MGLYKYFFLLLCSLAMHSCSKTDMPIDEHPCTDCTVDTLFKNIDTLWSVKLPGEFGAPYKAIFSQGDVVIFVGEILTHTFIIAHHKDSGDNVWEWLAPDASFYHVIQENGVLVLQNLSRIVALDANSGTLIHDYRSMDEDLRHYAGFVLGDYFYHSRGSNNDSLQTVLRTHVSDFENWETIYSLTMGENTGGSLARIASFNLWKDPETGEDILIMQHQLYHPNGAEVVAWNLTKDEMHWKYDGIIPVYTSNPHQILLRNNKAFFSDGSRLYCFDMGSGDILWQFNHPSGAYPMIHLKPSYADQDNAIIIKDDYNGLLSVDANTGNLKWMQTESGGYTVSAGSPVYLDGVVYYITEWRLWAADASTGENIFTEKGEYDITQSFRGDIAVDQVRGTIYTSTRRHIFAIKAMER